jgi:hypothetical protein
MPETRTAMSSKIAMKKAGKTLIVRFIRTTFVERALELCTEDRLFLFKLFGWFFRSAGVGHTHQVADDIAQFSDAKS